jgi:hypothetical protein
MPSKITGRCQNRGCFNLCVWDRLECEPCRDRAKHNEEALKVEEVKQAKDDLLIALAERMMSLPYHYGDYDANEFRRLINIVKDNQS